MSSVMSCGWQPSALQPTNQAASQISLKIPERLLAKGGGCIHQAVLAIALKVLFPLCLKLLCFFSSLRGSWGFWCSERGRRYYSIGACLFRGGGGQFHCNPGISISGCLGDVITNLFWKQSQRNDHGGQGTCDTDFPTGTPQVCDWSC